MTTHAPTAETQAGTTPTEVLSLLRAGNERFVAGETSDLGQQERIAATAGGQYPLAAVLGCIDSRVPVEQVLDVGIGDVFAARTAGTVVGGDVLGSFEFAAELAGVKAIVVLGHTACGAVKGACDGAELGHLTGLLTKIRPAIEQVTGGDGRPGSGDADLVNRVVHQHTANTVDELLERSDVLAKRVADGDLAVVGAVYDLATGQIEWLND